MESIENKICFNAIKQGIDGDGKGLIYLCKLKSGRCYNFEKYETCVIYTIDKYKGRTRR